jgi:hypothetical protein
MAAAAPATKPKQQQCHLRVKLPPNAELLAIQNLMLCAVLLPTADE